MRILNVVLAAAALGACVSATDCFMSIPVDLRADAVRYVIDKDLIDQHQIPSDVLELALRDGKPYAELSEDRRRKLAPYAAGYASCLRERVDRH